MNPQFVRNRGFGTVIKKRRKAATSLQDLLTDETSLAKMRSNLTQFEKRHFGTEIKNLVATMLEPSPTDTTSDEHSHEEYRPVYSNHL